MAVTIQLKNFTVKSSPVPADIIYMADSANSFDEVQCTLASVIGAYPNLLSIGGLTTAANEIIYTTGVNTFATAPITAFGLSVLALSAGVTTPTAGKLATWDTNKNLSANNFLAGFQAIATAAATTTLTVASPQTTEFTGTTTQTCVMPVVSTLAIGTPFIIINNSTGVVTVQSSGANTIQAMAAGTTLILISILNTGTTAASWQILNYSAGFSASAVLLNPSSDQIISAHNLFLTAGTFISGSSTGPQGALTGGNIQSVGVNAAGNFIASSYINNSGSAPTYWFYKSRSTTVGSFTALQTNDVIGRLEFFGDDGTQFIQCASMVWQVADSVSTGIVPTVCTFSTMSAGGTLLPAYTVSDSQIVNFIEGVSFQSGSILQNYVTGGSWTPVLTFSTPGDLSVSYATQLGTYTRVGNVVTLTINLVCTPTFTTASGTLIINGLPLASNANAGNASTAILFMGAIAYPATATMNLCYIGASYTSLSFYGQTPTGTFPQVGTTQFTSGVQVTITGNITYLV